MAMENEINEEAERDEATVERVEPAATTAQGEESVAEAAADEEVEPKADVKVVDKRRFARILGFGGGSRADAEAAAAERRLPSYVAQLEEQLAEVKARAEQVEAASRAEIEAARQRLERHYEAKMHTARADVVAGMLGVLDNLERALEAPGASESPLYEGIAATRDLFLRQLAELGAMPVPAVGEPFDPEVHEAIDEVSVEDPEDDGKVVVALRRGFKMDERLVRPAIVRVGRHRAETETGPV